MKEVYATNNEVEIQMLVGLLESQGILHRYMQMEQVDILESKVQILIFLNEL